MQRFVTGQASANSQPAASQAGGATFEDDKTVTQGQFPQQLRPVLVEPPAKENLPGSPRIVPVGAGATRSSSAAAARLPFPGGGLYRDIPSRPASVNLAPSSKAPKFWEGSTVDGSMFSDSASNFDISERLTQRPPQTQPLQSLQGPAHNRHTSASSHIHRMKREAPAEDKDRFTIGDNGLIGRAESPTLRPAVWTPSGRDRRSHFSRVVDDFDQVSLGSQGFSSPERDSPTSKRPHQPRQITLRKNLQQATKPRRASPTSSRNHAPRHEPDVKVPVHRLQESRVEKVAPHRPEYTEVQGEAESTDIDSPIPDPAETESDDPDQEPTPKKSTRVPKVGAPKPEVERQLFGDNTTAGKHTRGALRGMGMASSSHTNVGMQASKHTLEPDYDDQALASMQFDKLQNQDFDFDPAKAEALSAELPQGTLDEKLRHYVNRDSETQGDFFMKMSVRDWEDSGDWFLERFTDIVKNFRDARQARRALADKFEDEVAARADSVRSKIARIDITLGDMKKNGDVMMKRDFD